MASKPTVQERSMASLLAELFSLLAGIAMIVFAVVFAFRDDYARATFDLVLGIWLIEKRGQ